MRLAGLLGQLEEAECIHSHTSVSQASFERLSVQRCEYSYCSTLVGLLIPCSNQRNESTLYVGPELIVCPLLHRSICWVNLRLVRANPPSQRQAAVRL